MKQEAPIILPNGPDRDDTGGVQLLVAAIVVALDVVHVDGLGDAGDLIRGRGGDWGSRRRAANCT